MMLSTTTLTQKQKVILAKRREFDGRANSNQSGHKDVVKKWDMFAAANKQPSFHQLTQQFECGKVCDQLVNVESK
jgi:hypothetical protein